MPNQRSSFSTDYARLRGNRKLSQKSKWLLITVFLFGSLMLLLSQAKQESIIHTEKTTIALKDPQLIQLAPTPTQTEKTVTPKPKNTLRREQITVQNNDSLARIFQRLALSAKELHQITHLSDKTRALRQIHPGQKFTFEINDNNELQNLIIPKDARTTLQLKRDGDSFRLKEVIRDFDVINRFANGKINNSLYLAGQRAGLSDKLIMKLAAIFAWDIDFALDIRPGDSFQVLYEENHLDGKAVSVGEVIAAEFMNQGKSYQAIRYTDESGHTDYYTPDGHSLRKAFLRSPVNFTRISSRFQTGRKHPILHRIRAHKGVDYAAPRGTPIKAAGDGENKFMGRKGGYGKAVIIQHGSSPYSTLYAHLSGFKKGKQRNQTVKQGDVIGYVGSTGLASGPHLHYEFRVNDQQRDPLKIKLPKAEPIAKAYRADFTHYAEQTQKLLQNQANLQLTAHSPEKKDDS